MRYKVMHIWALCSVNTFILNCENKELYIVSFTVCIEKIF